MLPRLYLVEYFLLCELDFVLTAVILYKVKRIRAFYRKLNWIENILRVSYDPAEFILDITYEK